MKTRSGANNLELSIVLTLSYDDPTSSFNSGFGSNVWIGPEF